MSVGETPKSGTAPAERGRMDKRRAIVEAALRVFSRVGYTQASLDMIATEAGVAKPTIYNHLGSKENLFRHVMTETAARSNLKTLQVLESFPNDPDQLRPGLQDVAHKLVDCYCDEQSEAVRRLLYAEAVRFPDLFDEVRASGPNQFTDALAGRLARLANAGHLRIEDPERAANQFIALVYDELPELSALGTRPLVPDQVEKIVAAGVDTFLRAFGADRPAAGPDSAG
ncbi:TetR/AcrR family transcriptional regulator [Streptomyces flaveolus]|uniref:TetR/AcrR family transcriptional regulator n=1 Tax=Streptomyces flaveolus TaxID=67297 RepID=A0ABV3AN30_9ACTN|nr:TetR/AcrR family transcriptional regulator [Streptomyces antibioticus]KOG62346.1 TetR family transcriptional regulator [Streptomyces antibioticus]